ncbi:hypothetical protein FQR65_LT16643 [Abscondita terminalis]|nr:hypothetical protein FQR65_LT16643 [Abscondita terminalis]
MDAIQDDAISHYFVHSDPYSAIFSAAESPNLNETLEGTFEGIGLEYFNLNDTLLGCKFIPNALPAGKGPVQEFGEIRLMQIEPKDESAGKGILLFGADVVFPDGKVAVLINENSASASEIFAGADPKFLDRGALWKLPERESNDQIWKCSPLLTTPLGRGYSKKKYTLNAFVVSPAVRNPLMGDGYQLMCHEQAFVTKGGNQVYNGGGIYPDVVLPIDSNALSLKYQEINSVQVFTEAVCGYHLAGLRELWPTLMTFSGKNKGIVLSKKQENDLHQLIQTDIESLVGRFYFGRDAYFKVRNRHDVFVERAVNVLAPDILNNPSAATSGPISVVDLKALFDNLN